MAGVPPKLKAIAHYIKIANEYSNRDPAIYYWCLLHAVQKGMQIDKSSPECKQFLVQHLSLLEQIKKKNSDNEAITNEIVASAHVEEVALKLFSYADGEDRAARFNKNVVKSFYTAGYLLDVLSVFGEADSQIQHQQKYAKWKAAYIHNCLKNGETPQPGPIGGEEGFDEEFGDAGAAIGGGGGGGAISGVNFPVPPPASSSVAPQLPPAPAAYPTFSPTPPPAPAAAAAASGYSASGSGGSNLQPGDYMKAQKLCKYAISALEYEDAPTAVENLKQALALLQMSQK